jgi:predicted CopG family antitoxin
MVSLTFTDSQVHKLTRTEMAPYLQLINSDRSDLINKLLEKNKAHLEEIDTKLKEAITNEGDSEISEQLRARAMYYCRIGDKVCTSDDIQQLIGRRKLYLQLTRRLERLLGSEAG